MKRLSIISIIMLLTACGGSNSDYYDSENEGGGYTGNPYDSDSGHGAGYDWAERTGGDCSGNSASFNEGCEEYYRQIQE